MWLEIKLVAQIIYYFASALIATSQLKWTANCSVSSYKWCSFKHVYVSAVFVIGRPRSYVRRYVGASAARTTRTASNARRWCTWQTQRRWECYNKLLQIANCRHRQSIGRHIELRPTLPADGRINYLVCVVIYLGSSLLVLICRVESFIVCFYLCF